MNAAILGLGRFGTQLARELVKMRVDVLAVDSNSARVNELAETVLLAAEGNLTDVDFLESLGLRSYDYVVVAIGSDIAASVLITLTLKQRLRLKFVAAKSATEDHSRALELAGADVVVNPEREAAVRLAHTLGARAVADYMSIQADYGIAKVRAPASVHGIKIGDIDMQGRFKVFLLARVREASVSFNPDLGDVVKPGDTWIVSGRDADLAALQR
ncbi:MAG: TrkA family potassium uptake protein [Dehalococcoidia bacterium]|nr:TrkA family potassium uptake protein [Dehalococcoidia bacterium]MCB9484777.1 TrkA family potassium uptake protein [Thermoflexaceae bacterium]